MNARISVDGRRRRAYPTAFPQEKAEMDGARVGFLEAVEDLVGGFGFDEVLGDIAHECDCAGRHRDIALQNFVEVLGSAIVKLGVFLVLAYAGAVEIDAGKEALGAGVAEQLGVHLPVGGSCAGAAHRSGGCGGVSADFEFVLEQILHAAVIDGNEDQIGGLTAELEAERTAFHADKHRRAPAMSGAAGDDALAVLCAHKKAPFFMPGTTATQVAERRMSLGTVASLAAMIWSRTVLAESMRLCKSSFVEPAKAVAVSRKLRQTLTMAFFISMSFPFRRHDGAVVRIGPRSFGPGNLQRS